MQSQVIVPLDGSTNAEAILPHALFFAQQAQSLLTLLRVIMPPGEPEYTVPSIPDDWYAGEVMWTKNYLTSLATRLQAQGARVQTQYLEGTLCGATINSYAEQHPDVQLIALATHGRGAGGRLLLGSVAGDVFASAPTSLLLLHPPKDEQLPSGPITPASYQTIVVPLEGIVGSERVLEQATTLALACHASVLLVADQPPPLLEQGIRTYEEMKLTDFLVDQAERLRCSAGLTVQTAFTDGDPAAFIERLQGQDRQNLLIVTTRQQAEQLEYLQDTAEDWNLYRREHSIMHPDLSGADLSADELPGADLSGADLTRADLRAIDLTGSNLANADLTEANLSGAFLLNVVLIGANLTGADLTGANLTEVNATNATLINATLTGAILSGANLANADLTNAILHQADLSGANLTNATLLQADLTEANLADADLSKADLSGVVGFDLSGT